MGFWRKLFGDENQTASSSQTGWVKFVAGLSQMSSEGICPPQIVLYCVTNEIAEIVATNYSPDIDKGISGKPKIVVFEDGGAAVVFSILTASETDEQLIIYTYNIIYGIFKSPGYEGKNLIITNGFVSPTSEESRELLKELIGTDHAIQAGGAFVW